MKYPTEQELCDFVDGHLPSDRAAEIESLIRRTPSLKREITLLRRVRSVLHDELISVPSAKFTGRVMDEILPVRKEAFWMKMAKNSSNLFAMVLVLSVIGIIVVAGPTGSPGGSGVLTKGIDTYSNLSQQMMQSFSEWSSTLVRPVNQAASTSSGKLLLLGLAAFLIFLAVDELLQKRHFHFRMK